MFKDIPIVFDEVVPKSQILFYANYTICNRQRQARLHCAELYIEENQKKLVAKLNV